VNDEFPVDPFSYDSRSRLESPFLIILFVGIDPLYTIIRCPRLCILSAVLIDEDMTQPQRMNAPKQLFHKHTAGLKKLQKIQRSFSLPCSAQRQRERTTNMLEQTATSLLPVALHNSFHGKRLQRRKISKAIFIILVLGLSLMINFGYDRDVEGDSIVDRSGNRTIVESSETSIDKVGTLDLDRGTGLDEAVEGGAEMDGTEYEEEGEEMNGDILLADPTSGTIPLDYLDHCSSRGRCKFLIAAVIGEQETKSQLHLYQLGLLSIELGRLLVLPRVGESRLSSCGAHPFSLYYDPMTLRDQFGIPSITYEEFIDYSTRSQSSTSTQLTAQMISIAVPSYSDPEGATLIDTSPTANRQTNNPRQNLCLQPTLSGMTFSYSPISIFPPVGWYITHAKRMEYGQTIILALDKEDIETIRQSSKKDEDSERSDEAADALVVRYHTRWAILEPSTLAMDSTSSTSIIPIPPFSYFNFAPRWTLLADQIIASMGHFIGVHWRTETVPAENLYDCAEGLVSRLKVVKRLYPHIRTVYLATDYHIESITTDSPISNLASPVIANSGTFRELNTIHAVAFRHLVDIVQSETGLLLTGYRAEERKIAVVPSYLFPLFEKDRDSFSIGSIDSGLIAVLDKLIVSSTWLHSGFSLIARPAP
jgi:hypothetical protein